MAIVWILVILFGPLVVLDMVTKKTYVHGAE